MVLGMAATKPPPYDKYQPPPNTVARPGADDHKRFGSLQPNGTVAPYRPPMLCSSHVSRSVSYQSAKPGFDLTANKKTHTP